MHVACVRAGTVDDAIAALAAPRPFQPTLAIVFASVAVDLAGFAAVTAALGFPVIGCSSCGEILSCGAGELVPDGTITGVVLDRDPAAFAVTVVEPIAARPFGGGQAVAAWARNRFADAGLVVLGSGLQLDGERLVEGIIARIGRGRDIPLYGGLAGDDARFEATRLIANGRLVSDGVLAPALDCQRIAIHGVATSGWSGLGAAKRVTAAQGPVGARPHRARHRAGARLDGARWPSLSAYVERLHVRPSFAACIEGERGLIAASAVVIRVHARRSQRRGSNSRRSPRGRHAR